MIGVLILGAGGHAQVVADILGRDYELGGECSPIGFLDDDPQLHGKQFRGLSVLGAISDLYRIAHDGVIVAIGENRIRAEIFNRMTAADERIVSAIHPSAVLAPDITLGRGVMICARVVVNPLSRIDDDVILNTGCTIDHHNEIGPHAHVGPGAHTGGNVQIATGAFLGVGVAVIPGRRICEWAIVGGGAAVVHDIPPHTTAVGVPAKVTKVHESGSSSRGEETAPNDPLGRGAE